MDHQKQNQEDPNTHEVLADIGGQDKVDISRRKFTGAGLGVSAIFTLASQPVLATGGKICKCPSGYASLGFASHHGTPDTCFGKPPTYWCGQNTNNYPELGHCYHDHLSRGSQCDYGHSDWTHTTNGPTCKDVMGGNFWQNGYQKPDPVGRECAATLLNIRHGYIPSSVCTETKLITLWNEFKDKGYCQPTAGVNWYAGDIVKWCQSMQG